VIFHLNLLHLVLVLGAVGAVHLALREIRGRSMRAWRLFALPAVAVILAMILVLFQLAARQPSWWFGAALAAGAAVGAVRGATMMLKVDQNLRLLRPTSRRALLWVTLAIPIAIGVEIGGAMVGADGVLLRLAAAFTMVLCAGLLAGRAVALAARLHRAPHVDFRRMP
jgi:hypothetical protein